MLRIAAAGDIDWQRIELVDEQIGQLDHALRNDLIADLRMQPERFSQGADPDPVERATLLTDGAVGPIEIVVRKRPTGTHAITARGGRNDLFLCALAVVELHCFESRGNWVRIVTEDPFEFSIIDELVVPRGWFVVLLQF